MRKGIPFIVLAAIGACVSVTPPRGGTDAPVITDGKYKRGVDQLVRIALNPRADSGRIAATGSWQLLDRGQTATIAQATANEDWTV